MTRSKFGAAAALLFLAAVQASTPASAAGSDIMMATLEENDARTPQVSTAAMRSIVEEGNSIILDTRSRAEFESGHIPGALNIIAEPAFYADAVLKAAKGDRAAALVLYCNGPYCQASRRVGEQLAGAGFSNVRRYQLGLPVWRALGGPVRIELAGLKRILDADRSAVFVDVRKAALFTRGSLPGAISAPLDDLISGNLGKIALPEDDFNRRVVIVGESVDQAGKVAAMLGKRPWHNVMYFAGRFDEIGVTSNSK